MQPGNLSWIFSVKNLRYFILIIVILYVATWYATAVNITPPTVGTNVTPNSNDEAYYKELLARVERQEEINRKIAAKVVPWERCMRYHLSPDCESRKEGDPPCIPEVLQDMLFSVIDSFIEFDKLHFIAFGTLLGAVRDKKIIPWTYDNDVVLPGREWKELEKDKKWKKWLESRGYFFFIDPDFPHLARVCPIETSKYAVWAKHVSDPRTYHEAFPYMDIYPTNTDYPENSERISIYYGHGCTYDTEVIFPLSTVEMYGRKFSAPHNTTHFLYQVYGPDWRKPPKKLTKHGTSKEYCKDHWRNGG